LSAPFLAALRLLTQRLEPLHFRMKLLRKDPHTRLAIGCQVRDHVFQYASHLEIPSSLSNTGVTEPAMAERQALWEMVMSRRFSPEHTAGGREFEGH
jgi:hypothetical protein